MRFRGKVCLVTGAGSGIGRATALRMASEGGRMAVLDLRPEGGLETVERITEAGGVGKFIGCDVGNIRQVQDAVDAVIAWAGSTLHVMVNNAAMMTFKPLLELEAADWDHVLAVNLRSVFLFSKLAAPLMPAGGAIVNVSSVHAHETTVNVAPYAASKGGMEALTRVLALELAARKIRINCVAPGAVNTPMLWNNPNVRSGKEKITGAVGEPEDIAAAIAYLASDEAKFTTGTTLVCDGGRLDVL